MKSFLRAIRLALAYRLLVASSLFCSTAVALLWGGNIGAVYPFVEVAFKNQSLQNWVDLQIADAQSNLVSHRRELQRLEASLRTAPAEQRQRIERLRQTAEDDCQAEIGALARFHAIKPWIDRWLPHDPFKTLVLLVGLLLAGSAVKNLFMIINSVQETRLAQLAVFDLSKLFFRRTLRMELASFGSEGSAHLLSRFTYDMECVTGGLKALFGKAVREPLKMLACLIGAAFICWRLLLLSMVIAPLAGWLIARLAKLLKRANRRAMEEMTLIYNLLEEAFQGIKVVKAFTMERYERRRLHEISKRFFHRSMRIGRYDSLTRPATEMLGIITISRTLFAGAYLVLKEETHLLGIRMCDRPLSLSSLLLFYGLLAGVSDPARKLSEIFGRLQRAAAASDRIFDLIDRDPGIREPATPKPLGRHRREIRVSGVDFAYRTGQLVLEGIDLTVPFGETLAIVGPNGCGKSTLVNLLPRFFDPTRGSVTIDGIDLREVRMRELRSQMGLVTQETLLFDDTVYNNIRYGTPHATREQVIEAAKQAHAHRFIEERLELGYETMVGQRGDRLSGGQRQRIALARAILRDPAVLILDEATSQIDIESEQLIHRVLEQFVRNRTTFIITHRLATLELADRILVLSAGRIAGLGTHDELLRTCDL
ncbi:MAG: ABC transporter ATP-binding protein, partial [Planctomycetes bacterium]|nr:ABC transporter ATP-binding protein [Planctomycetota bacterium]